MPAELTAMSVFVRLVVMMFLQYFTWGAWWTTLGTYLNANFSSGFVGLAYATSGLAAIFSPFIVGMIADRYFPTQWVLAVLHGVSALLLLWTSTIQQESLLWWALLAYNLAFMPTLALTNSIAFSNLTDSAGQFPRVRVAGTIGWIVAGLSYVGYAMATGASVKNDIEPTVIPMYVAIVSQIVLAVFCLALPHTPPPSKGQAVTVSDVLGLDALKLLANRDFLVFVIGSFLISIPLQFYYAYTNAFLNGLGLENAVGWMTIGQGSEIFFMLLMPVFFAKLGVRWMLVVGMLAWVIRYVLFAFGDIQTSFWMLAFGLALHGICYDFFFVTGQIYTDRKAGPKIRGAAQGFITVVTLGLGSLVGNSAAGAVEKYATTNSVTNWQTFWLIPAAFAAAVIVVFAIVFRDNDAAATGDQASPETGPVV